MDFKYIQFVVIFHALNLILGNVVIYGPGLKPKEIVMPARYFFINFTTIGEDLYTSDLSRDIAVEINGRSLGKEYCRIWTNVLDRKDGSFIVRYKLYETCDELTINIYLKNKLILNSPLVFTGPIQPEICHCPKENFEEWIQQYECPTFHSQIEKDLSLFAKVNTKNAIKKIVNKYHKPESTSFCHYVVKDNKLYRDCYGKHVGFNMFSDNILLSLMRKVILPDLELVINLGDWPLVHKMDEDLPIFSWCGSDETKDIVMPTYDITESALENMGRVTLDTLSVQGNIELKWADREPRAFWRGRDSRFERLKLIDIARDNPDLYNVSLTNFFFFRDKESEYGPKQPHISFFKFFNYKYQINIDGTVAAYRFPYLLTGGGLVLKQDSPYYEHFYAKLSPWKHYIPVKADLSDLTRLIKWAIDNDKEAQQIAQNAKNFALHNLLPHHIICYHALLFSEWSKRLTNEVEINEGMTHVEQPKFDCKCNKKGHQNHEEL